MPSEDTARALAPYTLGTIESAVARLGKRVRGEGVALPGIVPHWSGRRRMAGFAIPVLISTEANSPHGRRENQDWWRHVEQQPEPKVIVAQCLDTDPGAGAACGILSAHVLAALGCNGFLTDGYVRDTEQLGGSGLLVASRGSTLRHGAPHIVRFGEPVRVFGMEVRPGDLVLADADGAVAFPSSWLEQLPRKMREVQDRVNPVLAFCRGRRRRADEIASAIERYMPRAAAAGRE